MTRAGDRPGPEYRRLHGVVDEVLHYLWDPIEVAGIPQARGEYESYVPRIVALLLRGGSEQDVVAFLSCDLSTPERDREVASILIAWRDSLADGTAERVSRPW